MVLTGLLLSVSAAFASFKGQVFIDKNGNNQLDAGEKGLANVAVSNGLDVTLTNSKGLFELPERANVRHVFITTPSGFRPSVSHFLHVDERTTSYSFGVVPFPRSKAANVGFIQITDTETYEDGGWIDPIKEYAANQSSCFVVHTGDICYEKGLKYHAQEVTSKRLGVPIFYCIGNHDLVKGAYGNELFEKLFGPTFYSFDAGNTHFVVTPMIYGDHKPSYSKEDVFNWLVNDLKFVDKSKNLVFFNHDLLTYADTFFYDNGKGQRLNLNEHNLKAWIYGHWHINCMMKHGSSGVTSVCASTPDKGGIDHSSSNFIAYTISKKGAISIDPRYNYISKHLVFNTFTDGSSSNRCLNVSANTYSTASPTVKVMCRIESNGKASKWFSLKRQTDWAWATSIPSKGISDGAANGSITVCSYLANGDTICRSAALAPSRSCLSLSWTSNIGGNCWMNAPVFSNGKVFSASMDEFAHKTCFIAAFDASTGKLVWKFNTLYSIKNTLCIEGNRLLATDENGFAYALDTETGSLLWKRDLGKTSNPAFVSGSSVNNGIYYTGFGNYLCALRVSDGSVIWRNSDWGGGEGTTATHTVAGNTLVASSNWNALFGHDILSGSVKWKHSDNGIRFRSSSPAFSNDTLFVASDQSIVKMNANDGRIYSVHPTKFNFQVASAPLVTDKHIIIGTANGGVVAFNRSSMNVAWQTGVGNALVFTSPYTKPISATVEGTPVTIGSNICFGASDGCVYLINSTNGNIIAKKDVGSPILSTVRVEGKAVFVNDFAGNIYRFDISEL